MIISIIQPCFVPWLGYFEQIAVADVFVYMDDVPYTKKDWRNGNQLKSPYGVKNIGFPVRKHPRGTLIKDVEISYNTRWESAFLNQLNEWYKKAPYFDVVISLVHDVIIRRYDKLWELNYHLNNAILSYLEIPTPIFFSSQAECRTDNKVDRIIEICRHFDGDVLFDGKKAQGFLDSHYMRERGIEVIFQDYKHTPYKQLWGDFTPYMSIIDAIMNLGKSSRGVIVNDQMITLTKKFK